jgi:hypothetical protein
MRSDAIMAKENAIKARLDKTNNLNKVKAQSSVAKELAALKKRGRTGVASRSYESQGILGADKGFSQSDYGVGAGAAIPYQIGTNQVKVSGATGLPTRKGKTMPSSGGRPESIWRKLAISNRLGGNSDPGFGMQQGG